MGKKTLSALVLKRMRKVFGNANRSGGSRRVVQKHKNRQRKVYRRAKRVHHFSRGSIAIRDSGDPRDPYYRRAAFVALSRFSRKSTCILPPFPFQERGPQAFEQMSMSPSPSTSPTCSSCPPNFVSRIMRSVKRPPPRFSQRTQRGFSRPGGAILPAR